ncbi:N-acetylmuramoyl-L-alanine amidase [Alkalicoccobacillus porphyridii]|uniref:N-acetylmuramoyl-L-alanine amidase n=1 Tax=Alkalicoccobacillus porphyridii TaxID=2597270 RepID=A0A554A1U5_9BACI|nr:N-acetylmuramoyl-L-alanine amidase [Alkalicoccobacillus porphyridii]TSB47664.1 N-acetylmuramoyl-L-alanine amidase [Alkalicoccobacillus porphyridii]
MFSKSRILGLCACFVFLFFWSEKAMAAEVNLGEVDTQVSLNVRAEPSEQAAIIGSLTPGVQVEYIELGNGWGQITYEGQLGFVSTAYLMKKERTPQSEQPSLPQTKESLDFDRIVIDAGHGGRDPGAIGNGLYEKTIALSVAHKVKSELEQEGIEVLMTRDEDLFVTLEDRVLKSNQWGADLFVSIHANGYADTSVSGVETFYYHGSSQGKQVASSIQQQLAESTGSRSRGVFAADFYVLKYSRMPAVLVETGFVSNEKDASLLKTGEYQQKAAKAIRDGILG